MPSLPRGGHGQHGAVAEANVHGGVLREDDLASARDEVPIDRAAASVGAHENGVGVVLVDSADDDPDELVSGQASGCGAGGADVPFAATADQRQTYGCAGGEIAGFRRSGFGAAFGVELDLLAISSRRYPLTNTPDWTDIAGTASCYKVWDGRANA